jgi:hypothetical protein
VTDPHIGYRSSGPELRGLGYLTSTRAVAEHRAPALTDVGGGM